MDADEVAKKIKELEAERRTQPRLKKILDELMKIVSNGQQNMHWWHELKKLSTEESGMMSLADMFFIHTAILNINQTIIDCSKLLEADKESINVSLLLNTAESQIKEFFDPKVHAEVKREIVLDRELYQKLCKDHHNIKLKRDKEIAHLDKKVMTRTMDDPQITADVGQLNELLKTIESMLRKYYNYAGYKAASNFQESQTWAKEFFKSNYDFSELKYVLAIGLEHLPADAPQHIKFHQTMREAKGWYRKNSKRKFDKS